MKPPQPNKNLAPQSGMMYATMVVIAYPECTEQHCQTVQKMAEFNRTSSFSNYKKMAATNT